MIDLKKKKKTERHIDINRIEICRKLKELSERKKE